jgi:hypothetical protein
MGLGLAGDSSSLHHYRGKVQEVVCSEACGFGGHYRWVWALLRVVGDGSQTIYCDFGVGFRFSVGLFGALGLSSAFLGV